MRRVTEEIEEWKDLGYVWGLNGWNLLMDCKQGEWETGTKDDFGHSTKKMTRIYK